MFFIIGFSLLISGCIFGPSLPEGTNIGGVDIQFAYEKDQPPRAGDTLFEGDDLTVSYYLINNIPSSVSDVKVCVWDTPPDSYGGIQGEVCQSSSLNAAQDYEDKIIPYQSNIMHVTGDPYINVDEGITDTTIYLVLTYSLETESSSSFCLIKDSYSYDGPRNCPSDFTVSGNKIKNDFAPLIIEKIDVRNRKQGEDNKIILDIYFRKSVQGDFKSEVQSGKFFEIGLDFTSLDSSFTCNPTTFDGKIQMNGLNTKITCSSLVSLENLPIDYVLQAKLKYSYEVINSRGPIKLKKV